MSVIWSMREPFVWHASLAAQCEIPPNIAQYLFEIVSQRGVSRSVCLVFIGHRASIAEIPLLRGGARGGIAPPLRMFSKRGNAQKMERGYRTQLAMLRHQKPHSAQ